MAPYLTSVSNASQKSVCVFLTDGRAFSLEYEDIAFIDVDDVYYFPDGAYMKIYEDSANVEGYRLRYSNPNIAINDITGKKGLVQDTLIHPSVDKGIYCMIYEDEMVISGSPKTLGIYQHGGGIEYYDSVRVTHIEGGGVKVIGYNKEDEDEEEGDEEDEDEDEEKEEEKEEEEEEEEVKKEEYEDEASVEKKGPHADDDGPTEKTSNTA